MDDDKYFNLRMAIDRLDADFRMQINNIRRQLNDSRSSLDKFTDAYYGSKEGGRISVEKFKTLYGKDYREALTSLSREGIVALISREKSGSSLYQLMTRRLRQIDDIKRNC